MSGRRALRVLAARRLWVYGGGLALIAAARLISLPRLARVGVVCLALAAMVLTYAGEQVGDGGNGIRPWSLGAGLAGLVVGTALALTGTLAGLAFVGGGLLFLRRALGGGGSA